MDEDDESYLMAWGLLGLVTTICLALGAVWLWVVPYIFGL